MSKIKLNAGLIIASVVVIIIVATLPFHYVFYEKVEGKLKTGITYSSGKTFRIYPKLNLTFSNTFVFQKDIDLLVKRFNESSVTEQQVIGTEPLYRILKENGIIYNEEDKVQTDEKVITENSIAENKTEKPQDIQQGGRNTKIPPPPNDKASDFEEYTVQMLISKENLEHENANIWYGEYEYLTGIIIEVEKDLSSINIHVVKTGTKFKKNFGSIDGEDWTVDLDQTNFGNNKMSQDAATKLHALLVPGRRIKFAMVEGYPGCGTVMNGVWFLTYAKALDGNAF